MEEFVKIRDVWNIFRGWIRRLDKNNNTIN
jgi:hypothetical protein